MRLLVFHADSFRFDTDDGTDATATGTDTAEREDCLAAFVTVETGDETAPDAIVADARDAILDLATTLRADDVVLYPTANLGDDPADAADAETAGQLLAALEDDLRDGRESDDRPAVVRAPMGWNTSFVLAAKAHPLAEQSRQITAADATRDSPGTDCAEQEILFPDGSRQSLGAFHDAGTDDGATADPLRTLADHLVRHQNDEQHGDSREYWATARESGLLTPADGSAATPRLTPQGTFVRDAIAEYVRAVAMDAGAVPIDPATDATDESRTPVDAVSPPPIRPAVLSALERRESTGPEPSVVCTATRVAAADADRSGQPRGTATTPEVWTKATDRSAARTALATQVDVVRRLARACALDTVPLLRVRASFAAENRAWLDRLVETLDEPMVVERRRGTRGEWPVALAFVATVAGQPVETGTVWLRPGDGRVAGEGAGSGEEAMAPGALLCCTPVGAIERATATVGARATTRDPPRLPTWLAPTQVRLVPTDPDAYRECCREIAAALEATAVRVDVDDRDLSVGERLDRADADWLPYDAVVGSREADGKTLAVTVRETGEQIDLTAPELGDRLHEEVGGRPRKRLYLPKFLSERPASRQ